MYIEYRKNFMSRNQFFGLLLIIFIGPFLASKFIWLSTSALTTGTMRFTGHDNLGSVLGISTYPVIRFTRGTDTIYFNGNVNIDLQKGEMIPVRYQKNNPSDAKVSTFVCIWGDTLAYGLLPLLVLVVLYLHPDIKSSIHIGKKPFIMIVKKKI